MLVVIIIGLLLIIGTVLGEGSALTSLAISGNGPVQRGYTAEIFCDYEHVHATIVAAQWYKYDGEKKIDVYTYARGSDGKDVDQAKDVLEGKAELRQKYGRFTLLIHDMQLGDEGLYQCQLYQSYSIHKSSRKYVLQVSIPASTPIIESSHSTNGSGLTVHCSGNVGRPGGTLSLYRRTDQNWTLLESYEIQRIYANQTLTTFVKSSITDAGPGPLVIKCLAKNDGDREREFIAEKTIDVPVVAENRDLSGSGTATVSNASFHVAGYTTIALLLICMLLFALYMINRNTNMSLKRCIKRRRTPTTGQNCSNA